MNQQMSDDGKASTGGDHAGSQDGSQDGSRDIATLATPSAVLDLQRLDRNIVAMQGRADRLGVRLRPHAKTS